MPLLFRCVDYLTSPACQRNWKELCICLKRYNFRMATVLQPSNDTGSSHEYKNLRNCAVQSVEDTCGATASQVLQDEITNLNGAGLELACQEVFGECSNSAVTLASPFLFILFAFLYMFL
ncbi:hypothetical protein TNIN_391201 [Trichonephila inaurata madagascariensis]|uniref:Uncharacterized protein n=1 Tax=Trichonephila inaurata madagascariensis TaxID=2747483 RepID=A0A8X7CAB2_9ARAC|nr:hypothetical protein TNIN_391201 [Trichonephila inaurata madagascariensis]